MRVQSIASHEDAQRVCQLLATQLDSLPRWRPIRREVYSQTVNSDGSIKVISPADWISGYPIKWTQGGIDYYGIIAGTSGDSVVVYGPPISSAALLSMLWVGQPELVKAEHLYIPGNFNAVTNGDILSSVAKQSRYWVYGPAKLVAVQAQCITPDSGAGSEPPTINIGINGTDVLSSAMAITSGAVWSAATIDPDSYGIAFTNYINVACVTTSTQHNAADLSIDLAFVME